MTKLKDTLLPILILALLYFITGKLSFLFLHSNNIVNTGIFPAEGIALAFILFFGKRVWTGIFLGQFILAFTTDIPLYISLGIAATNSFEALIAFYLFKKSNLNINLERFKDVFGLITIILFIQIISASFSNTLLLLSNIITANNFLSSSFSWWFGNVMGQLLFTPFILLTILHAKSIKWGEYLLYMIFFAPIIYISEKLMTNIMLLLSISIPFIVFMVSYKGYVYGTALSVVLALASSYSVFLGQGVFHLPNVIDNIINYNLFILAHISMVFMTGVLFEERKRNLYNLEKKISNETEKNKEQQLILLQQSRLAQMGEMIAMIAHQWRQPLNNLSLANQLLIAKYNKGKLNDKTIESFKYNSQKQITHMSKTIDDFRNFFKSEKITQEYCVNEVIENVLSITQDIYANSSIHLEFLQTEQLHSTGYPNELGQAILNIINNAKDALEELDIQNKYITISLDQEDNMILIFIKDNAGGIPPEIHEKVFDPYFSTKKSKNGTGLGLYMTKMIITEKLNGQISFKNIDEGVQFKIELKEINNAT